MCGIVGYKGSRDAAKLVISSLKTLEYRGYDSWGLAGNVRSQMQIYKKAGKISEASNVTDLLGCKLAIGHTRWATHGGVTDENAHPHLSNDGLIAVVHNGIVENFQEIKLRLIKKGYTFKSETDTEVIPLLIEDYAKELSFIEAAKKALKDLKGNYAVVALSLKDDLIIASRRGSPLVVGVGNNELFVASDIPAFIDYTKQVIYLHDNDFVVLNKGIRIFNLADDIEVHRAKDTIKWNAEQAKKGRFKHFMLKEITEQVESVERAASQDRKQISRIADEIKKAKGIFLVACGSSYHACLTASYLFSKIAKIHVNVVLASEFHNHKEFLESDTLIVAVSQSGETIDVLDAVKTAKEAGSKVISVVNVVGSSLTRESDQHVLMHAGPEICVLSTKTYTSQLAVLALIAYALIGKFEEGRKELRSLLRFIYYLTSANAQEYIRELAERLRYANHIFMIGRDLQFPTALEAALKIKEVSYIHAEGFAGGELKHGTIALIEHGTPCIVFVPNESSNEVISNATEIKSRGGYIIGIGPEENEVFDFFVKVRDAGDLNSICQIIPIQILAYQLAILRGHDPDKPRNLAKSVTVK